MLRRGGAHAKGGECTTVSEFCDSTTVQASHANRQRVSSVITNIAVVQNENACARRSNIKMHSFGRGRRRPAGARPSLLGARLACVAPVAAPGAAHALPAPCAGSLLSARSPQGSVFSLSQEATDCFATGRLKHGRVVRIAHVCVARRSCVVGPVWEKLPHRTTRLTLYYYCGAQSVTGL